MDKDKPIDRKENNIENKKEDYKDSNGNPEDFIENMNDPEATAIFKEAFYAEGKALEEEALRSPFVEDEEKKEALRLRILAAAVRREDEVAGESTAREADAVTVEKVELKTETTADENAKLEAKVAAVKNVNDKARSAAANGADALEKKKRHKFSLMARWAAVIILACVGVFGVSMTSQAKGSGFWSSIQRLIGGETRWEQENNGEDRNISEPDEYKAIEEIQEKLGINIPKFFYWPGEMSFSEYEIFDESGIFLMVYTDGKKNIFFEGCKGEGNVSSNSVWQRDEEFERVEYDNVSYSIMKADSDEMGTYYLSRWAVGENIFSLYGITDLGEMEKILKNLKN